MGELAPLALLRRFPGLERLPREPFVEVPTPVSPLAIEGIDAGLLWVKRDDRSCPFYGGNKPRKLEFVIGDARARGARRLVTTGGLGTHHGLATTILGARAGLATTVVVVDQPVTPHVRRQAERMVAYGAELVWGGHVPGTALAVARVLARARLRGERPVLVSVGGSSPLGTLGFVSAAFELHEQVGAGALPEPAEVHVAIGSGGTLAGLVLGARLLDWPVRIVGVLVNDILPPTPRRMARLARAALARMRAVEPSVPEVDVAPEHFHVTEAQLGAGYGHPTPAAREAVALAGRAGLALETTYTGKCLAESLARLRAGTVDGPVLFWNTYNGVDVDAVAPRKATLDVLPGPICERLLRVEAQP